MPARLEGQRVHLKLAEDLLTECGRHFWYHTVGSNGRPIEGDTNAAGFPIYPIPQQKVWARDLLAALHRHVDFDGTWVIAWCDPVLVPIPPGLGIVDRRGLQPVPARCTWFLKDRDGDVLIALDTEDSLTDILRGSIDERVEHTAVAYAEYRSILRDVGIDGRHMRKAALGQAPADPTIRVVPFVG